MVLTTLQRSVLYTLAYTAQFQYPLTTQEVWFRLIARLETRVKLLSKKPTVREVKRALDALVKKKLVTKEGSAYALGRHPGLAEVRRRRFRVAQTKWREVRQAVTIFRWIPWIQAIFITGSLAMDNTEPEEDIDFMIVTSTNRLWITRLMVSGLAWLRGKRRSWHGEEKRSWCFNLWIEEDQLGLFQKQASLYTAYEIIQARLLFDRNGVGKQLLVANPWVNTYLPLATELSGARPKRTKDFLRFINFGRVGWLNGVGDRANDYAFRFQQWYMKSHMTREKVAKNYALFHPRDTKGWLYAGLKKQLESIL